MPLRLDLAGLHPHLVRQCVEAVDIGPDLRLHHHVLAPQARLPPRQHALGQHLGGVAVGHPAVRLVEGERGPDPTLPERLDRRPLPFRLLAPVAPQRDAIQPLPEAPEAAAGVDLGQLPVVPDQQDRDPVGPSPSENPGERPRVHHAGLVDDQHRTLGEPLPAHLHVVAEHRQRPHVAQAGAVAQLVPRPGAQ